MTEQNETPKTEVAETEVAATEAEGAGAPETENSAVTDEVRERPEQSEEDDQKAIQVEDRLYDVIDPELGINVVDLGLVYDIWIENGNHVVINMTLTSPACPLTDMLEDQVQSVISDLEWFGDHELNWVWIPPWGPHMISDDGREQLRAIGFNV